MSALSALTREELQKCQDAFRQFDIDHSGSIDTAELRDTLNVMGHHVTEEECFLMMSQVSDSRRRSAPLVQPRVKLRRRETS
jgi:Ca2+-binding EF-hand superfamily protein